MFANVFIVIKKSEFRQVVTKDSQSQALRHLLELLGKNVSRKMRVLEKTGFDKSPLPPCNPFSIARHRMFPCKGITRFQHSGDYMCCQVIVRGLCFLLYGVWRECQEKASLHIQGEQDRRKSDFSPNW